jgi:signal peptidase
MHLPWKKQQESNGMPSAGPQRIVNGLGKGWWLLSWLATVAVVVVMVGVIAFVTVPRILGWHGVVVLSGSMEPTLATGGIAWFAPVQPEELKAGDVLTFKREGTQKTLITHRIVDIQRTEKGLEFTTKGDANNNVDGTTVKEAQVVGKVVFDVPHVGNAVDALQSQTNYYIFIGIPAALLILNEIVSIGAELRKARNKKANDGDAPAPMEGAWS